MTEDGPEESGVGCTAAIVTAHAEGLHRQLECFRGIMSLEKNRKNSPNTAKSKLWQ